MIVSLVLYAALFALCLLAFGLGLDDAPIPAQITWMAASIVFWEFIKS